MGSDVFLRRNKELARRWRRRQSSLPVLLTFPPHSQVSGSKLLLKSRLCSMASRLPPIHNPADISIGCPLSTPLPPPSLHAARHSPRPFHKQLFITSQSGPRGSSFFLPKLPLISTSESHSHTQCCKKYPIVILA